MAVLLTLQGPEAGRKFSLDPPHTILGRQYAAEVCLSGKAISRQHAQILARDARYFVEDLESSNGTFLNGLRLPPRAPVPLTEQDTLQIGPYVFALRDDNTAAV